MLKEITLHSLRVLVTHALVVAERFPHLHSEVRDAAPVAPPVSTCPSRALLNYNLSLRKTQQGKKKQHEIQRQSKQLANNNASTTLRYNYHLNRQEQANLILLFIPISPHLKYSLTSFDRAFHINYPGARIRDKSLLIDQQSRVGILMLFSNVDCRILG